MRTRYRILAYSITVFSLAATIVACVAGIIIIQNYLTQSAVQRLVVSNPQAVIAKVEDIKKTLEEVEQLSIDVESLGNAAIEAQKNADEARLLANLSEDQIRALENRLNPAGGLWLNIGIGVAMLFVGYFLDKIMDRVMKRFRSRS
jgi:hypothetical protein